MNEPWNLRGDVERTANTVYNFIIFCEDGAVEPAYFHSFATNNVMVNAMGNLKAMHDNVDSAVEYFKKKNLLEKDKNGTEWLAVDEGTQVWCVFDRDKNKDGSDDKKDSPFDNSIQNAMRIGIRVAWSNDAFELWVLMHFEDIPTDDAAYAIRTKYYERLTHIMKTWAPKTEEHDRFTKHEKFNYNPTFKNGYRFKTIIIPLMKNKINDAINRAVQLEAHHNLVADKPDHQKAPQTLVHHLVSELLRLSGKTI